MKYDTYSAPKKTTKDHTYVTYTFGGGVIFKRMMMGKSISNALNFCLKRDFCSSWSKPAKKKERMCVCV